MSQFQPISLCQTEQISSQQQLQQQLQNQYQQYQLVLCDIKPQFTVVPNVSHNLTNSNNNSNNTSSMNTSQSGMGNFGALMTTLDTVVSGMNNNNNTNNNTGGGQAGQFATPMSHADVASLLMHPAKRAETFFIDEIKVMLKEIEARKHILLSLSPSTNRLKRRAWEDVAMSMAARWPRAPRRTADQVKKKWENLVSKTKRKVRAGHITSELDWNETNAAVMQFLTQNSPLVRLRYLSSTGPSLLGLGELQASSASVSTSASSVLNTSASTAMNGTNSFSQTNSHIYGLSNTSFTDPYSSNNNNGNNNSSIFSNTQQSFGTLSATKSAILSSCLQQDSKNNSNNNNNNNNNNNSNGQQSLVNHETIDLTAFNNTGSGTGGDKQHLNTSAEDKDVEMTTGNNSHNNNSQNHGNSSEVVGNITGSVHESILSSFSPLNQSFLNFDLPATAASNHHDSLYSTLSHDIQEELYAQLKEEHELRMDTLRLQKQTWLLQMNLFKKMKVEQISSLLPSPQLSVISTTTAGSNTTPTTNTVVSSNSSGGRCNNPVTGSNTSVSASLLSVSTVPSNEVDSLLNTTTSVASTKPSSSPVIAPTTMATPATSTTTSNSSIQHSNVNQRESNCAPMMNRPLSPMFPNDGNNPSSHSALQQNVLLTSVQKIEG